MVRRPGKTGSRGSKIQNGTLTVVLVRKICPPDREKPNSSGKEAGLAVDDRVKVVVGWDSEGSAG